MARKLDYLSVSRIGMYTRCPAAYFFHYECGITVAPRAATARGGSFHNALGHHYMHKLLTEQDVPEDELLDYFCFDFEQQKHSIWWFKSEDPEKIKDQGVKGLRLYHREVSTKVRPALVEHEFELEFGNKPYTFRGRLDLLTRDGVLVEAKSKGRSINEPEQSHILQITAYAAGVRLATRKWPVAARADYTIMLKRKPKLLTFPVGVSAGRVRRLEETIGKVAYLIEAGMFYPDRSNYLCSASWCGYWDLCRKEYGE